MFDPRMSNQNKQLRLTYAITPPNQTTPLERRQAIARTQSERIAKLPIDALLVYDLQDETARTSTPRPFPFVPKVDALSYAYDALRLEHVSRIVYRALAHQSEAALCAWLSQLQAYGGRAVFVGAPSRHSELAVPLPRAFALCREHTPGLDFGGVVIAERHENAGGEHQRLWWKRSLGCGFFVSQTMWSARATCALLSDVKALAERAHAPVPRVLVTLSPCGSERTLAFQEWLGVNVPAPIKRQLSSANDMLERSVELALEVYAEVREHAVSLGIEVGCNVESVSSRAVEVDASLELLRRVAALQKAVEVTGERRTKGETLRGRTAGRGAVRRFLPTGTGSTG